MQQGIRRCDWSVSDPLYVKYHDTEWGVPVHEDRRMFEFVVLEGAQAGLSWLTVLKKRENYRKAFDGFDPAKVSRYGNAKISELLKDGGIIRNELKIKSAVSNAHEFLRIQEEFGSFSSYMWDFAGGKAKRNRWTKMSQLPAHSKESDALSRDLHERGFRFFGTTICYAHMQATGMVNDHLTYCFRYKQL